ncbi:hypothetical protein HY004_02905 [Candidatus Saccharibacteria bacterium]|nr:hypothetical protein [Candidatus Saccharibacteria bacterium]
MAETKTEIIRNPELAEGERYIIGDIPQGKVPYTVINRLHQTRQVIKQDEIEELKGALIKNKHGVWQVDLLAQVRACEFPATMEDKLQDYLDDLNATWGSKHKIADLDRTDEGNYVVLIFGHRRMEAAAMALEEIGIPLESTDVVFQAKDPEDITFDDVISDQYRENFHQRPDTWEDAYALTHIYSRNLQTGRYKTFKDCANHLSIGVDRVARAHRFETLPEEVKELTREGVLPFYKGLMLTGLFSALALTRCKDVIPEDQFEEFKKKQQSSKLYLPEVLELLDKDTKKDLLLSFVSHAAKAIPLSEQQLRGYINSTYHSIFEDNQLTFIEVTEEELERKRDADLSRELSKETMASLKQLIGALAVDQQRIKNGRRPLFLVSRRARTLLRRAVTRIDKFRFDENHPQDIEATLEDLKGVAEQLEANEDLADIQDAHPEQGSFL